MLVQSPGMARACYSHAVRTPSSLDIRLFEAINRRYTHALLDWLLPRLTLMGLGGVQLPAVLLVWWLHRDLERYRSLGWIALAAFLLSTGIVHLIKRRVKRLRPVAHTDVRFLVPETRHGSFPSGHTATTFALAAVLAWYFPLWSIPLLLLAALVGYSRIYVGVHFLSDVAVAALIGVVSAAVALVGTV
jgi:undecaprenyl-diphosphatase